jgi:HEAT repeat protein
MFGPKAERAVSKLIGDACNDPAYETRRMIAQCLAHVGYNDKTGPNVKALNRLAATLAKDQSAAVRMEALQALVALGPPWAGNSPGKGVPGPTNWKAATFIADRMRERLVVTKTHGIVEHDKQLEIWCRIVLMRFDEKELAKEDHLNAITTNFDAKSELGAKLQALQALALFGERAAKQVDKVVPLLSDGDQVVVVAALTTLRAMGVKGQPALDQLEKTEKHWAEKLDERKKQEDFKKVIINLKDDQIKLLISSLNEEQMRLAVANTIKFIKDSKPGKPGGDMVGTAPAPAPSGEKK